MARELGIGYYDRAIIQKAAMGANEQEALVEQQIQTLQFVLAAENAGNCPIQIPGPSH